MEIRKLGIDSQDNCKHEFKLLASNEKTMDGFYKEVSDYKPNEFYNVYICNKCSRIVTVDYTKNDISPVIDFESEYKIEKTRKR